MNLTFSSESAANETFSIAIIDDDDKEDEEAFEITVTPVMNAIVLPSVIRVTICCDPRDGGRFHCM